MKDRKVEGIIEDADKQLAKAIKDFNKAHSEYCVAFKAFKEAEKRLEQARKDVAYRKPFPVIYRNS
jgi:hypothetical protein